MATYVSHLSLNLDKGLDTDAIYTDFSSAFDKVGHFILIGKLSAQGVFGALLDWFRSYLNNRPQIVSVKGYESKVYFAKSGVPQGSHLGPVLFLIFINDITQHIKHCKYSLFADDLKIYKTINSDLDVKLVQEDINSIVNWCGANGMQLNPKKCFHIKFSKKIKALSSKYNINKNEIAEVFEIKDLGVVLDSKLKYLAQYNQIVKKAAQMLGFLKRNTKEFKKPSTKITLYNALVRSVLEYASIVWNPTYSVHTQRIESIQRSFTRHLAFISSGISHRCPYPTRLQYFKIDSLYCRRHLLELSFLHKIINGNIDCSETLECISLAVPTKIPRQPITRILHTPFCRTNTGLHAPVVRLCSRYNHFKQQIDNIDIFSDNAKIFKKKVLEHFRQQQNDTECN